MTKPTQSIFRRTQVLRLGDLGERDEHGDGADGHVDEEDPAPADAAGDGAPDERADGDGAADHGAVDTEGRAAVAPGEGGGDQRQRGGEHDGAADALHGAGQVEHEGRGREAAHQRGDGEDDQADGEDLAPPVDVARHAGGQQEGGQRQRVGVHDPLQVREARVQRRWMSGSATFTTVMSRRSMKVAVQTAIRVHHLRSRAGIRGVYRPGVLASYNVM